MIKTFRIATSGGLGLGDVSQVDFPTRIQYDKSRKAFEQISDVTCGANHCLAMDNTGTIVYSWGSGQGGRLGHGDETGE